MAKHGTKAVGKRARLLLSVLIVVVLICSVYYAMNDPLGIFRAGNTAVAADTASPPLKAGPPEKAPPIKAVPTVKPGATPEVTTGKSDALDAYVLDVGQGDCIFLRSPSGKTMLVDAGTSAMYERIAKFLKEQKVERLDVVIATHPHADHIGGMAKIVKNFKIGAFYMPDKTTNTKTFDGLLDALEKSDAKIIRAKAGKDALIEWDDAVEIRILSPLANANYKDDLNNYSVMCRVKYGETAIMLTGDAEESAERAALKEFPASYFKAQILKAGHHGSSTSTSLPFLNAVKPEVAIMSLGVDNTYGHPHKETIKKFDDAGIRYYRTDKNGTVHIRMDGKKYEVSCEKNK